MKIQRHISILVVLAVGVLLANASWPEATFAKAQAPPATTCVQATEPVNTWCVPATSGAGVPGTFCTTSAPSTRPVVTSAETLGNVIGSILAFPFEVAQCVFGECP